ncbi:hypothetical protein, partial [Shigella sonnei]|uniref:hypothetical protein n=1 Tax=Shigella sonnei TaxID=624 RepID=UPI002091F0C5
MYDGVFEVLQWLLFLSAVPPVQLLTCLLYTDDDADEEDSVALGARRFSELKIVCTHTITIDIAETQNPSYQTNYQH